jgi:hypothetical protein
LSVTLFEKTPLFTLLKADFSTFENDDYRNSFPLFEL